VAQYIRNNQNTQYASPSATNSPQPTSPTQNVEIITEDLHKAEAFFASLENRDKNNVDISFPKQNFHESHQ